MTSLLQDKLYELHSQAPSPSKDFHHFTLTRTEVIWRSWRISLRPNQENIFPKEVRQPHSDFLLNEQLHSKTHQGVEDDDFGPGPPPSGVLKFKDKLSDDAKQDFHMLIEEGKLVARAALQADLDAADSAAHEQVQNIFGNKMLEYTLNLCQGCYDFLPRMPDNLIMHILSFLNANDIRQLSKTCKKFQQLCSREDLWESVRPLQDKHTHDLKIMRFPVYKKLTYFNQKPSHQKQMQRRQTTFF
ncbi:F-box only protein 36-like [Macrochelys suwanniensis]